MCRVQSARLATVEALSQIMRVPEVEIPDLRALDAHDPEEVPRRQLECLGFPRRHRELGNFGDLNEHGYAVEGVEGQRCPFLGKPVSSMIQASTGPLRSIAGSTNSLTLASIAASDHGAFPTKWSSD